MQTQATDKVKIHSPALASQTFMPTTYDEAIKFCELASKEDFIPSGMRGKPMAIFLAWQMGASVGLDFFASIQNIAVINGKPCIYGDAALAVIMNHPHYQEHEEWYEVKGTRVTSFLATDPDLIAFCSITRKGQKPTIKSFGVKNAIQAGLWEKAGPWKQYPERMLQMRARGFCMRDAIPGALKGLAIREEAIDLPPEDYHVIAETKEQPKLGVDALKASLIKAEVIETKTPDYEKIKEEATKIDEDTGEVIENQSGAPSYEEVKKQIENAKTVDELIFARDVSKSIVTTPEQLEELRKIFQKMQKEVKG